jgi:hypothetical protein
MRCEMFLKHNDHTQKHKMFNYGDTLEVYTSLSIPFLNYKHPYHVYKLAMFATFSNNSHAMLESKLLSADAGNVFRGDNLPFL